METGQFDILAIAKYFCGVVRENCEVTEDLDNLIKAVVVMAEVSIKLKGLKRAKPAQKKLEHECSWIVSYLIHKAHQRISNQIKEQRESK